VMYKFSFESIRLVHISLFFSLEFVGYYGTMLVFDLLTKLSHGLGVVGVVGMPR